MNTNRRQNLCKTFGVILPLAACSLVSNSVQANESASPHDYWINAVLRNEQVHQSNLLRDANAVTLRTRVGYQYSGFDNLSFLVEGENIIALDESYNSTTNGRTNRSVVPDPEDTELNRLILSYTGIEDTKAELGRLRIVVDNARFIGNVGWRQNEQTFDGLMVTNTSIQDTTIRVGYIDTVRRIFGPDSPIGKTDMSSPIVNVNYRGIPNNTFVAYGYFLDLEDNPLSSNRTLGLRLTGKKPLDPVTLHYQLEFADQADYRGGSNAIDASYLLTSAAVSFQRWRIGAGYELLSGDGTSAFQTPLATGHAFNGWSDQFLVTPGTGLRDTYLEGGVKFLGVNLRAFYHEFEADSGGQSYGSEINAIATRNFGDRFFAGLKFADYQADQRGVDTTKLWLYFHFDH